MDGLLESFSRVTRVWCTMRRREEGARSCFDSFLFSLPPPLVSLLRPSSSFSLVRFLLSPPHSIHSLFSRIRLERGYSLNLNVFFFFLPPQGRIQDTAPLRLMITRRFDADRTDTRADEYLI